MWKAVRSLFWVATLPSAPMTRSPLGAAIALPAVRDRIQLDILQHYFMLDRIAKVRHKMTPLEGLLLIRFYLKNVEN